MALTQNLQSPQLYLQSLSRWRPAEIAFWLATLLPFVLAPNYLSLASQIAIVALFALSLDLILGYAGVVSLGHAAFFGIGAYSAGLISKFGWGEPLTGLLLSTLAAGLVGYATSFIIARFRGLALIMLTLGFGENWVRMSAIGAPNRAHIRTIYTIAAALAGIAGALVAETTETVSLDSLGFERSAEVLVMLVLGGAGRLYGGLVGATIFMVARDQFSGIAPEYWYFWIGILLIVVVILLPNGVLGGLPHLIARWRRP